MVPGSVPCHDQLRFFAASSVRTSCPSTHISVDELDTGILERASNGQYLFAAVMEVAFFGQFGAPRIVSEPTTILAAKFRNYPTKEDRFISGRSGVKLFKTKEFIRFGRRERITDARLCEAATEAVTGPSSTPILAAG